MLTSPALPQALQRLGFKRWHERQLLALLALLGLLGGFEALGGRIGNPLLNYALITVSAAIGWHGLRRYAERLRVAEAVSLQASCPQCGSYGRLRCLGATPDGGARVCCRSCERQWEIRV